MGFVKTLIKAGNGVLPKRGQSVTVHCTGYGKNRNMNEKFWSTKDAGQEPFTFKVGLGQVIKVRPSVYAHYKACLYQRMLHRSHDFRMIVYIYRVGTKV